MKPLTAIALAAAMLAAPAYAQQPPGAAAAAVAPVAPVVAADGLLMAKMAIATAKSISAASDGAGGLRLLSRGGHDVTWDFQKPVKLLAECGHALVLDGEIAVPDDNGVTHIRGIAPRPPRVHARAPRLLLDARIGL